MNAVSTAARAARRAYEIARLRTAAARAIFVAAGTTTIASASVGASAFRWFALPWLAWTLIEWRGGALRQGGVRGLVAGMTTLVLPLTWLRSSCAPGMAPGQGDCCVQPSLCVAAGAMAGLVAALALPASTRRLEASAGVSLGLSTVVMLRCAALFLGETAGFLVGVALGVVAATLARMEITRRRAHG
jgi:hypothetical protein